MEEDLNLERSALKIIEYCWYNKKRFRSVEEISMVTKISPKAIFRIAYNNNLPSRRLIYKYATDKKSAQVWAKV